MKTHPIVLATAIAIVTTAVQAQQTQLNVGDVAFIQASADAPDTIAFVPLVNIKAGTYLHITDNARLTTSLSGGDWRVGASLNPTEGTFTWVAGADIAAGTVVSFGTALATHGIDLSASGDNLIAYQGTFRKPQFLTGIGWANPTGAWVTTGVPATNSSYVPSNLVLGASALDGANLDNISYTAGPVTDTQAALFAALNTPANWTGSDAAVPATPGNLTVTGAISGTAATERLFGFNFGHAAASYSNAATVALGDSALSNFTYTGTGVFAATGNAGFSDRGARVTGGHTASPTLDLLSAPYLSFTLAMDAGKQFDLTHVELSSRRDANASGRVALWASTDGFASSFQIGGDLDISGSTNWGTLNFDDGAATNYEGMLDFRIYAWSSAGTGAGNWDVDEVWVNGAVTAVPEPGSATLLLGGLALLAGRRRRSFLTGAP